VSSLLAGAINRKGILVLVNDVVKVVAGERNDFVASQVGTLWRVERVNGSYVAAGRLDSDLWTTFLDSDLELTEGPERIDEVLSSPHFKTDALNRAAGLAGGNNEVE